MNLKNLKNLKNIKRKLLFLFIFLIKFQIFAQCPTGPSVSCNASGFSLDLYWVGTTSASNSGNWSSPCSWRVGSTSGVEPCQAPRSIDNVFFTNASFVGSSGTGTTITINSLALCNNFYVDPNISSLTGTPTFSLSTPGMIEVYGSFTLQSKLTWTTVGGPTSGPEIYFKATAAGKTIKTSGKFLASIIFDGIGGQWRLQDDLNAGNMLFRFGNFNTNDGTTTYNLNLYNFSSKILTGATSANRVITLNNSIVTLTGTTANRYPDYNNQTPTWDARLSNTTNTTFNTGTSIINFTANTVVVRLGGWTYNIINHTGNAQFYDHFGNNNNCFIDTLTTNGFLYFYNTHTFNVLKINSIGKTHDLFYPQTINTDLLISTSICTPTILNSSNNTTLTIPAVVSADPMVGVEIRNLRAINSHTVTGWKSGVTTGWTVNAPTSRDLYWVGTTNTSWSNPTNWSTDPSGTPLLSASDCKPSPSDNVFFTSIANGRTVNIDSVANCKNMTWSITAATTFSGSANLNIYGDLTLDSDITLTNTSLWYLRGTSANTFFSAGKTINNTVQFSNSSSYTLLDALTCSNNIYFFYNSSFNSGGFAINAVSLTFESTSTIANFNFSNSTITLSSSTPWRVNSKQGSITYNFSSQVIFTNTTSVTLIDGYGEGPKFPNLTLQSPLTTLRIANWFSGLPFQVAGNLVLNGNAIFCANNGGTGIAGNLSNLTITGDLTLAAGKTYEFGLNGTLSIGGTFNSVGTCSSPIIIKGTNGAIFNTNCTGSNNISYTSIANSNSASAITANNSMDMGGNTNWSFTSGGSSTYYWRAAAGACSPCVYNGDWLTGNNWTTNPLATQGTVGCAPGSNDNVVFDNLSYNSTQTTITISAAVFFNNITINASNVKFSGTTSTNMVCGGNVLSDGTAVFTSFLGSITLSAATTGKTINFGNVTLGGNIYFNNSNSEYTLNNHLITSQNVYLNAGILNTNGYTFEMKTFNSSGVTARTLNLGNSTMNITGSGTAGTSYLGDGTDVLTWDTKVSTNFTFTSGTSTINFTNATSPIIKCSNLNFYNLNFTSTASSILTSPALLIDGCNTRYMKFFGSGRIYGNNSYDTLFFSPGKIYRLENNKTQTLNAPNGILIATGTPGNEIAIKAINTGGTPAKIKKLNSGGSMTSFCFDYISVEDNEASSDDPTFRFFTALNSNNISGTGIWDFSRAVFYTPFIQANTDTYVCEDSSTFVLSGSGPYLITYTINGGTPQQATVANGTPFFTIPISKTSTTTVKITNFKGDNCGVLTNGVLLDDTQIISATINEVISDDNDSSICVINNENSFIHFYRNSSPQRLIYSIKDAASGVGLGTTTVKIKIDPTVQTFGNNVYMQRRFGFKPTNQELSTIRLYFSQSELDALSTANVNLLRPAVTLATLLATGFENNAMNFTGTQYSIPILSRGTIPAGLTTSSNIYYVEIDASLTSHIILHPQPPVSLPIELLTFNSKCSNEGLVTINWSTATETNNDYFTIEESRDGNNWNVIKKLKGAGNSTRTNVYSYRHLLENNEISYYRLKQTDFNGHSKYSDIISSNCEKYNLPKITIFPNPTSSDFIIELNDIKNQPIEITINDLFGRIIEKRLINVNDKIHHENFTLIHHAKGVYTITIKTDTKLIVRNIIKVN
jgi:hypothetical protein